jgi:hypothetical protein
MKLTFCIASLLLCSAVHADEPTYTGKDDCRFVNPSPEDFNKGEWNWEGACTDGYANGPGALIWTVKGTPHGGYEGSLVRGRAEGQGLLMFPEGDTLSGHFANGEAAGLVERKYKLRGTYRGEWRHGQPNGAGEWHYGLGLHFNGNFKDGEPVGEGVLTYPDKRSVTATFPNGTADVNTNAPRYALTKQGNTMSAADRYTIAYNLVIPADKSWNELTPEQQAQVKRPYAVLLKDDEPPYPVGGTKRMYNYFSEVVKRTDSDWHFTAYALIGTNGQVVGLNILEAPSPEMTQILKAVLVQQKFKPAKCSGEPCPMFYAMLVHGTP